MEQTPQNIKLSVPFFMVRNMQASLRFYCDGFGFNITNQWAPRGEIEWCWLQRDAVSIMLQQPRIPNTEQQGILGAGVTICHQCADALALYHEFLEKGLSPAEPFVGNGYWVVSIKDPDGYRLEFESLTDVPEETTYSQWRQNRPA